MSQANILVLDLCSAGDLGNEFCEIFSYVPLASAPLRHDLVLVREAGDFSSLTGQASSGLLTSNRNDVVLLLVPHNSLGQARLLVQTLSRSPDAPPLIVVTEAGEPGELFVLLESGAADFITPPFKACDILPRLWRLIDQRHPCNTLLRSLKEKLGLTQLVGESPAFRDAVRKIPRLAQCDAGVLIAGETGTGKEMCARAIHYLSPRAAHSFVAVNCGAIPTELIENELFGHERGAFTGANRAQPGLIREADGGSLFLDEIDSLLPAAQVKLLRLLQEGEYRALGSSKSIKANVRIIAATNADVGEALKTGKLRLDLFYRLNVLPLALPPLRDRREDIPRLARYFLARHVAAFHSTVTGFTDAALERLACRAWPGNIRELENLVVRAAVLAEHELIGVDDLGESEAIAPPRAPSLREAKAKFERDFIEDLLRTHHGNITTAARAAHKDRRSFWELIRKHKIDAGLFKSQTQPRVAGR